MPLAATSTLLLAGAGLGATGWCWRREQRRVRAARARLLRHAPSLLEGAASSQDGLTYPVLRGRYFGCEVELRPEADTIGLRKLPSLWLLVTVTGETGAGGVLDAMLRPLGVEYWSPHHDLPVTLPTPAALPEAAVLRGDDEERLERLVTVLQRRLAGLLALPEAKEVLVTPRGVRLVVQLAEGARGSYLLFRDADFPVQELAAMQLADLLERAHSLLLEVRAATGHGHGARRGGGVDTAAAAAAAATAAAA